MKNLLFVFLLFCRLHNARSQVHNDLAADGLKGKVRIVTEMEFGDAALKRPFMKNIDEYDKRGYLTLSVHYDYTLNLHFRKVIKYDTAETGLILLRREYDDTGMLVRTETYSYDSLGRVAAEEDHRYYDGKETVYRNEYAYDLKGKKIEDVSYCNKVPGHRVVYTYDTAGKISASRTYNARKKLVDQCDYYYFRSNEWVQCEKQCDTVRAHVFRAIDSFGRIMEKTTYAGGYKKYATELSSEFDRHGNWLQQSTEGNLTEHFYVRRKIEYYK
jgi:hypothetical protein